jgi:hypothetical protein
VHCNCIESGSEFLLGILKGADRAQFDRGFGVGFVVVVELGWLGD